MALASVISGPYTNTWNSSDMGQTEDGFRLRQTVNKELVRSNAYGDSQQGPRVTGTRQGRSIGQSFSGEPQSESRAGPAADGPNTPKTGRARLPAVGPDPGDQLLRAQQTVDAYLERRKRHDEILISTRRAGRVFRETRGTSVVVVRLLVLKLAGRRALLRRPLLPDLRDQVVAGWTPPWFR